MRVRIAMLLTGVTAGASVSAIAFAQPANSGLVKEVAINDASVPKGLTTVGNVVVGKDGRVYVAQPQDNVVLMFDAAGKFIKAIGGKGQGPGETENLSEIGFVGDTLWTSDWRARRFAFFDANGGYLSSFNSPAIIDSNTKGHFVRVSASTPLSDGTMYFASMSYASYLDVVFLPPVAKVVGTRDGRTIRTVAMTDSLGRGSYGVRRGDNGQLFTSDQFFGALVDRSPLVATAPNGVGFAIAFRDDCNSKQSYAVRRVSLEGKTLWTGNVECPRVPVPKGFVDSIVAFNVARVEKMQVTREHAESQIRPKIGTVRGFTPARSLQIGNDGSIWIRPLASLSDTLETWRRVDTQPSGPTLFTLPPRTQLRFVVDASHIWVTQLDDDDLPSLVRYRTGAPAGR